MRSIQTNWMGANKFAKCVARPLLIRKISHGWPCAVSPAVVGGMQRVFIALLDRYLESANFLRGSMMSLLRKSCVRCAAVWFIACLSAGMVCGAEETPATSAADFELDVQPIFTKFGCNAGACHGKQREIGRASCRERVYSSV